MGWLNPTDSENYSDVSFRIRRAPTNIPKA
jgi:hypothetical protein